MSIIKENDLEKIYNIQKTFKSETKSLSQHFIILFFLFIILILYVNLTLNIDFSNWELSKCNPKYLFISGYIKKNPGYNANDSTVMNFWDCLNSTNPEQFSPVNFLKDIIGKKTPSKNNKNDIIRRIKKGILDKEELNTINKNKVNSYKNIDLLKVKDISTKYYLLSIYLKEYLNNVLTYILSKFIIKFEKTKKRSELYIKENDLSDEELELYKSKVDASLNLYKENSFLLNDLIKSNLDRNKL
tara:strand:+ start:1862 stop:2593 length:732 start_codon:yes stop_codon:yes gene_type:complete